MSFVKSVKGREILDSRGNPTIEVEIVTDRGFIGTASVPSGASTGENEALEMRDSDPAYYGGKGVKQAVARVNGPIAKIVVGQDVYDQKGIDRAMIEADGTENKSRLGANAILGTSLAIARAGALSAGLPLYRYIGGLDTDILPCPMINIVNGGAHADNALDFQEFMIRPIGASSFHEAVRFGAETFHALKRLLQKKGYSTGVGDEGGFAPGIESNEETLDLILEAIVSAGFRPGIDISLALDCAASEFYERTDQTYIEKKKKARRLPYAKNTAEMQIAYLETLCANYPVDSIEDGLAENDTKGWQLLTERTGNKIQLVGDDIFVTNPKFLKRGIAAGEGNAVLIKPNQIGTLSETLETVRIAQTNGYGTIISHRSGETEDPFIADLTVATGSGQIKTGSLSRSERIAKYNRLLKIESDLGKDALYRDGNRFRYRIEN